MAQLCCSAYTIASGRNALPPKPPISILFVTAVIYNIQKISNYLNNQQQVTRQLNHVHSVEEMWALAGALPILASLWSSLHVSWVLRPGLNLFFPCDSRRSKVICATDRWRPS